MPRFRPAEIARRAGVNKSTVSRQLREWPHLLDTGGTVDLDEYLAARAGSLDPLLQPSSPSGTGEPSELTRERTRKLAAEAERAEIELRQRKGELIALADIEAALNDAFQEVRNRLLYIPRDHAAELHRLPDEVALEARLTDLMVQAMGKIAFDFAPAGPGGADD